MKMARYARLSYISLTSAIKLYYSLKSRFEPTSLSQHDDTEWLPVRILSNYNGLTYVVAALIYCNP